MKPERIDVIRQKEIERDRLEQAWDDAVTDTQTFINEAVPHPDGNESLSPSERFNKLWGQVEALLVSPMHEAVPSHMEGYTPSRLVKSNNGESYELSLDLLHTTRSDDDTRYVQADWVYKYPPEENKDPYQYTEMIALQNGGEIDDDRLADLANLEWAMIAYISSDQIVAEE